MPERARQGGKNADGRADFRFHNPVNCGRANTSCNSNFLFGCHFRVLSHPGVERGCGLLLYSPFAIVGGRNKDISLYCVQFVIDIKPELFFARCFFNDTRGIRTDVFDASAPPVDQVLRALHPFCKAQLSIIEIPANDFVKVFASYVINTFHSYCICPFNVT